MDVRIGGETSESVSCVILLTAAFIVKEHGEERGHV